MKKLFFFTSFLFCSVSYGQECTSGDCSDGHGTYTWTNGFKYVGEWQYGKRNGKGTLTLTDGTLQSGIWEDNSYFGTKAEWDAKERFREKARVKYNKIYNDCLLDKSSGADMQVSSKRRAVEETCESIAEDPSWIYKIKYFRL